MDTKLEEYRWLASLGEKIRLGKSSIEENNEFVDYIYASGKMDKELYDNYKSGKYTERILNTALIIGVVSLLKYVFEKMFQKDDGALVADFKKYGLQ